MHYAALLTEQDVLTEADRHTLLLYCKCLADEEEVANTIRVDGWVIPTQKDGMIRHPLCTLLTTLRTQIKGFAEQLGLSPASRARTKGAAPEKEGEPDGFDAI
jgi:P27 family predicted phage terminase small subunit